MSKNEVRTLQQELESREARAQEYLRLSLENWRLFLAEALGIKDKKLYKIRYKTWKEYCRQMWNLDDSRIRQLKAADEVAAIIESVNFVTPEQALAEQIARVIPKDDRHLVPFVFAICHERKGDQIAPRHIRGVYDMTRELLDTGTVSIDGQAVPAIDMAQKVAFSKIIMDADERYVLNRRGNKSSTQYKGHVIALQLRDNRAYIEIELDTTENLLVNYFDRKATIYIDSDEIEKVTK